MLPEPIKSKPPERFLEMVDFLIFLFFKPPLTRLERDYERYVRARVFTQVGRLLRDLSFPRNGIVSVREEPLMVIIPPEEEPPLGDSYAN